MAVLIRATQKDQVAHDAALSIEERAIIASAHEPRMKGGFNLCLASSSVEMARTAGPWF
jgi:hypothetical protein